MQALLKEMHQLQAWQPIAQLPASRLATVPEEVPDSEHEEVNEDTFHEALEAAHDTLPDAANATADIIRTHGADQTPADMSKSASAAGKFMCCLRAPSRAGQCQHF